MIRCLRRRSVRIFLTIIAVLILVAMLATGALVWDGLRDEVGRADVGLVLGNTVHPDGTPSRRLAARLERTLELYREGYFPLIIVSGGLGQEGHDEALVMRDYLVQRGVPTEIILVDSEGLNTFASARKTQELMRERGLKGVLVITQYFHVPRSRLALQKFGIPAVYSAHARYFEGRDLYSIPREIVGLVSYATRSYEAGE